MRNTNEQVLELDVTKPEDLLMAKVTLSRIYKSLKESNFDPRGDEPFETCDGYQKISTSREVGKLALVELMNGVAVLYTSPGEEKDYSHRFIFPDDTVDARYYGQRIARESRIVPIAPAIILPSIEAIATDEHAKQELLNVADMLEQQDISDQNGRERMPFVFVRNS